MIVPSSLVSPACIVAYLRIRFLTFGLAEIRVQSGQIVVRETHCRFSRAFSGLASGSVHPKRRRFDGSFHWHGPQQVGSGWTFKRIFSGGDGVVYAIRQDGKLFWYRHLGFKDGARSWSEAKEVGSGWGHFKDVFSLGQGAVYAVTLDGTLLLYQQKGFETGEKNWYPARTVGSAWNQFQEIVQAGNGVILAIRPDGALIWYKHLGLTSPFKFGRLKDTWATPVTIGSGWQGFGKVFAMMPATPDAVR